MSDITVNVTAQPGISVEVASGGGAAVVALNRASRNGYVAIPDSFGWDPPLRIHRWGIGPARSTFHAPAWRVPTTTIRYVDPINGLNTNDGLTWATAWQTITYALDTLIALTPESAEIQLKPGSGYLLGFGSRTPDFPLNVVCEDGLAIVSPAAGGYGRFTAYNSIWTRNMGAGDTLRHLDFKYRDAYNRPSMLTLAASLVDCESTPGTYWVVGNVHYVHLADDREPDTGYVMFSTDAGGSNRWTYNGPRLYAKGIASCAGVTPFSNVPTAKSEVILDRCEFYGSNMAANVEGLKFDHVDAGAGSFVALVDCVVAYTCKDGIWYNATQGIEERVTVAGGGFYDDNANNSTAHGASKIVRISSRYLCAPGSAIKRSVHDVHDDTASLCVDCYTDVPEPTESVEDTGIGFAIGIPPSSATTPDSAKMWLNGCSVGPGGGYGYAPWGGAATAMYWQEMTPRDSQVDGGLDGAKMIYSGA